MEKFQILVKEERIQKPRYNKRKLLTFLAAHKSEAKKNVTSSGSKVGSWNELLKKQIYHAIIFNSTLDAP